MTIPCPVCGSVRICPHAGLYEAGPGGDGGPKLAEAERDRLPVWLCATCVCFVGVLFFAAAIWGLSAAIRAIGG